MTHALDTKLKRRSVCLFSFLIVFLGVFFVSSVALACECYDGDTLVLENGDLACFSACGNDPDAMETDPGMCSCPTTGESVEIDCAAVCTAANADYNTQKQSVIDYEKEGFIEPKLQVEIPGLSFSKVKTDGSDVEVNWLGEYIMGLYKYLLSIAAIIAIVMIMIGGLQYTFAGGHGDTGKGKKRIKDAITGLVLLFTTYFILWTANPNLTIFKALTIESIDYEALIDGSGDVGGNITTENLADIGITCDSSEDIENIAKSFIGKTAYRFGGKGGKPPYPADTKIDSTGRPFKDYCPTDNICLDCSGYVGLVTKCAGLTLNGISGGTAGIFASAPMIRNCEPESVTLEDGTTVDLVAGDVVGFKDGDRPGKPGGHVWIYIGNGLLINSVGSIAGRAPGSAVITQPVTSACSKFPLRLVDQTP